MRSCETVFGAQDYLLFTDVIDKQNSCHLERLRRQVDQTVETFHHAMKPQDSMWKGKECSEEARYAHAKVCLVPCASE